MPYKFFEHTIPFTETPDGWFPLVPVTFIRPQRSDLTLTLLFDTGADDICLHPDNEWAFSGFNLQPQAIEGVGSEDEAEGKKTRGKVTLLGRSLECDILFAPMRWKNWRQGVLGRSCLTAFGVGFWESARELYVTLKL